MSPYQPDYTRVVDAAWNRRREFIPLYEHAVSLEVQEQIAGTEMRNLLEGSVRDKEEAFRRSASLLASLGYDVYPFEGCVAELVQGGQGLMGAAAPIITSMGDLEAYSWDSLPDRYFDRFDPYFSSLRTALETSSPGMKAVAGVGNGPFEIAQDFVPLTNLAYLEMDEPETFSELWTRIGDVLYRIWRRFLERYADLFCVCRIGDDFGFKTSLLLKPETFRTYVLPVYRRIIELVHLHGKPFLLHSCGAIWELMDELIDYCRIDAKHSNEDAIAPFSRWLDLYGKRIGNFGGVDMNVLCTEDESSIRRYVKEVLENARGYPGVAVGSGNQIAGYVPPSGFLAMVETVREFRGEA